MSDDGRALWLLACGLLLNPQDALTQIAARLHQTGSPPLQVELLSFHPPTNILYRTGQHLRTNGFQALIFVPPETTNNAPSPNRLLLRDGSDLSGTLLSMNADLVVIDPAHSPPLTLPRNSVASLRWTERARGVTYEGPSGSNDWIISGLPGTNAGPSWILRDGLFLARGKGTLARDCGMSTVARVEFDLYWLDQPRFRLNFFSRETRQLSFSEGYVFYSPGHGTIFAMTRSADPRQKIDVRRVDIPALVNSNYVHLDFRLNSQRGEGWLFADGKLVRHWTDLGISGAGQSLVFQNFDDNTRLAVTNLRVSDWDGRTAADPPPEGDITTIIFMNGDSVRAKSPTITGTNVTFQFNNAPLTVPASRIAQIHSPPATPPKFEASTWIQFVQGDWLRAEILSIHSGKIRWRREPASAPIESSLDHVRGVHLGREKPVMDLSWYFPKTPASKASE
ncbi:MAG: hypothetical protein ISQ14_05135 [Verrucomicrobiae bacterium]|nr:hypothetical protein [Verrucomicrobiae bacterium]